MSPLNKLRLNTECPANHDSGNIYTKRLALHKLAHTENHLCLKDSTVLPTQSCQGKGLGPLTLDHKRGWLSARSPTQMVTEFCHPTVSLTSWTCRCGVVWRKQLSVSLLCQTTTQDAPLLPPTMFVLMFMSPCGIKEINPFSHSSPHMRRCFSFTHASCWETADIRLWWATGIKRWS